MTIPTPTRSSATERPLAPPKKDQPLEKVFRGGWFVAEDLNGEQVMVRLPARVELGA